LQRDFYVGRSISEKEYKLQFNSLQERLAEIETERTTLAVIEEGKKEKITVKKVDEVLKSNKIDRKLERLEKKGMERGWLSSLKSYFTKIMEKRKAKRGESAIEGEFVKKLKERVKDKHVKGKWIHLGRKKK